MPLTESVSSVMADMSAIDFWVCLDASRRTLPTRNVRYRKKGRMVSEIAVRRQSSKTIANSVMTTMVRLLKTELAVSVTTDCTPPTSLAMRLWISPVRVSVKKRRGMRWRWA